MKTNQLKIHSQEYMETMARLMSEALESPEGMRALAAAIAAPIEQEIKRKEISSLLLTKHTLPKGERPVYQKKPTVKAHWISKDGDAQEQEVGKDEVEFPTRQGLVHLAFVQRPQAYAVVRQSLVEILRERRPCGLDDGLWAYRKDANGEFLRAEYGPGCSACGKHQAPEADRQATLHGCPRRRAWSGAGGGGKGDERRHGRSARGVELTAV